TPEARPKPDARALVGNTSEVKICIALPATCTKNTMMNPAIINWAGVPALPNTIAMMPAPMNAQIEVIFRPNLSSAYIMNMLAVGTAKFITSVYCSDLVIEKPLAFMILGSQAPSPTAMPKNAVKQIMPATTRRGNILKTSRNGSLWVLLAADAASGCVGPAMPSRSSLPSPCSPGRWGERERGDSGSGKQNTQTTSAQMPMRTQPPRQTVPAESNIPPNQSTSAVPTGPPTPPPMKCTIARM